MKKYYDHKGNSRKELMADFKKKNKKKSNFRKHILRPFLFSKRCKYIKVPYVYGFIIMTLFIASVIIFLYMALSKQYDVGTLGVVAGVIGTMAGLYFGTLRLYNHGKIRQIEEMKVNNSREYDYESITKDL